MLSLKKLLYKMLTYSKGYAVSASVSWNVTFTGTYTTTELSIASAVPSGYKPIAVIGEATGANDVYFYQVGIVSETNKTAVVQLKRTTTGAVSCTPRVRVISVRA